MPNNAALLLAFTLLQGCQSQASSHASLTAPAMNRPAASTQLLDVTLFKSLTLIAQQEAQLPDGAIDSPDRPIGFASIFLTLENPSDRIQTLELLKVEVIAMDNGSIQLSSDETQIIKLMPLENAVLDVQLNNLEGYGTEGEVKAIATYRIHETVHSIESTAVEVR